MKYLLGIFVGVLCYACAKQDTAITTETYTALIETELEEQHIPAVAALVAKDGNVVYEQYFGQQNIDQQVDLQADHLFLLASVSKMITATALLQLYDDGLFGLDDPINAHLPFQVNIPQHPQPITFRMLLTHTASIADGPALDGQYYSGQDSPIALADFLEDYLTPNGAHYDAQANFHPYAPGTVHEYSNIGTALIGLLVETIAQQPFDQYCQQHIFDPLGMLHTGWRLNALQQAGRTIVVPYEYENGSHRALQHYTFTDYPNGGLRSTAPDLLRFLNALHGVGNSPTLLKPTTVQEMHRTQIPDLEDEMGLHVFKMEGCNNFWGHEGGEDGTSTVIAFQPDENIAVILLANMSDVELEDMLKKGCDLAKAN